MYFKEFYLNNSLSPSRTSGKVGCFSTLLTSRFAPPEEGAEAQEQKPKPTTQSKMPNSI